MRTNGREDVSRREAKRVLRARAGRRATNSRGPEVQRSDAWRAESNARATTHRRNPGLDASVPRARRNGGNTKQTSEALAS